MLLVYSHAFLTFIIQFTYCQRRIINGTAIKVDKPYAVYLVRAPPSPQKYDAWLCGGAIVSSWYIITSAACVEDVQHMYAVAGYKKYVRTENIDLDECTKTTKKKVVFTCVPKSYELDYEKLSKWSYIDIALVKVESSFRFDDDTYIRLCSYKPATIAVNYDAKYQNPGIDALIYGWGHSQLWRKPGDSENYNMDTLQYAPQLIFDKQMCKDAYKAHDMDLVIDRYMLCAMDGGNINDQGNPIQKSKPVLIDGCATRQQKLMGAVGVSCEENDDDIPYRDLVLLDQTRRNGSQKNETYTLTRRHGICQNDHGGPLVTWVGANEVLIGVASVFRVNDASKCVGPFLYTSTQCNGAFLDCILSDKTYRRSEWCDQPPHLKGFDIIERRISWADHPAGPAENEVMLMRPQVPLYNYAYGSNYVNNVPLG